MKKLILLPLIAIFALTVSCERDTIVEPIPPTLGTWDELIFVRLHNADAEDTGTSMTLMTWGGLLANAERIVDLDDLVLFVREVEFREGGIMRITTRFLEANLDLEQCGTIQYGVAFRQEFMEIEYTIASSHSEDVGMILVTSGQFTGPNFDQTGINPLCSPTGNVEGINFQFSYQQDDRRTMNFYEVDAYDGSFRSIHFLRLRRPPVQ